MKSKILILAVLISIANFFTNCAVEKRHYLSGYHFTKARKTHNKQKDQAESYVTISEPVKNEPVLIASLDNSIGSINVRGLKKPLTFIKDSVRKIEPCDTIYFRTGGDKIACVIKEVGPEQIKYIRCNYPDGPLFIADKSDVKKIWYNSGKVEIVEYSLSEADPKSTQDKKKRSREQYGSNDGKRLYPPAVLSFCFGTLSVLFGVFFIGALFAIPAVLLSTRARNRIKNDDSLKGERWAKLGYSLATIGVAIATVAIFL